MRAENMRTVFNVALYLLQIDQDLAYFTTDMVEAIGDRRRAFVASMKQCCCMMLLKTFRSC